MPPAARPSARYRSSVVVILLGFILAGFFALGRLPVELPPSREAPRLELRAAAPGLTAPVLEPMLTRPLERLLAGIPGVLAVDSVTVTGGVTVVMRLRHRRDLDAVQREVGARLERAAASWPDSVDPPVLALTDDTLQVAEFVLTSRTLDALALRDWAETEFARRLRELDGVATVDVAGGAVREIQVLPDQRRLAGYGLAFADLLLAIRKNPEADSFPRPPSGKARSRREPVQSGNLAAVAALPVVLPGGESIQLSEVARLALSHQPSPAAFRVDGAEAVRVTLSRLPRTALSEVAEKVRAHVDWMRANRLIPESIHMHFFVNHFEEARRPLRKTAYALLAGFALALAAFRLLGGSGRRTLLLGVIVAAAVQGIFIFMAVSGVALDALLLGGLALGIGLFGGSAMLMFSAADRPQPARGLPPAVVMTAAVAAALASLWFAGDELGLRYREPVAVCIGAWILATLLAVWLVPLFDAPRRPRKISAWNTAVDHAVAALRRRLLPHAVPVLAVVVSLLAGLAGFVFMHARAPVAAEPAQREIALRLRGPDSAELATLADAVTQRLRALPVLREAGHSAQAVREEWVIRLDQERARELGMDLGLAGKALAIATDGIPAGSFRDAERRYELRLRLPPEEAGGIAAGNILLLGELENRPAAYLRDIAVLERAVTPAEIRHRDGEPEITILVRPADGVAPERVTAAMQAALDRVALPPGYQLSPGREDEGATSQRSIATLGLPVLLVSVALLLLQRSWRPALAAVLTSLACVLVTAAVLPLFGVPPSAPVWLAMLLLLGISAGHAAVLPAAGQTRVLLVVVLAAVLGMLPMTWVKDVVPALSTLAGVLATGLVLSLPLNLLLTPLACSLFAHKEQTPASRRL